MIYLDTSAVLAELLAEDQKPDPLIWNEPLVSSRLLEYEVWTRINAKQLGEPHEQAARTLLSSISFLELSPSVLRRALDPFPVPVRTLDALHLASIQYMRERNLKLSLLTFDNRMLRAARRLGIPTVPSRAG
jgi:predicted nucleic acid-binding protein